MEKISRNATAQLLVNVERQKLFWYNFANAAPLEGGKLTLENVCSQTKVI